MPVVPRSIHYQIFTEYHLRQGSYKVKCNSDSSSHKTRSVLLFCGPAHTDSLWAVLTRVKSGQAQFDEGQNGPGESSCAGTPGPKKWLILGISLTHSVENRDLLFLKQK